MTQAPINKMGGFIAAHFIPTKHIQSFIIKNGRAHIQYHSGYLPTKIDMTKNGASVTVTTIREKGNELFEISADISLKSEFFQETIPFNKCLLLLTRPDNTVIAYGSRVFPLTLSKRPVISDTPGGFSGDVLSFYGKTIVSPAPLTQ